MHADALPAAPATTGPGVRSVLRDVGRTALSAPFTRRARGEVAYCLIGFPLALLGFVPLVVLLALGAGLTATLVGAVLGLLFLVAATALARGLGGVHRRLAAGLLGERVVPPRPFRPGSGTFGRLDARLRDVTGWRAVAFVAARLPVSALGGWAVTWWVTALMNLSAPLRWAVFGQHPERPGESMPVITPVPFGGGAPHASTFAGTLLAAAIGAATLLAAPWVTRGVAALDRRLVRSLLGPGTLAQRVRDLEETRALAVDDSVALLRRLERDLHDGAQVRLVALAMTLDMAKERVGDDGVPSGEAARLRRLLETAHLNATEALTELRDLARGIHPPALDDGLPDALATLAARSAVPVELTVDLPRRPTQAIETIAYFCAAELLTNVIKHSGATRAVLAVEEDAGEEVLRLRVVDNGRGGALAGGGSGLTGLAQRARTVDGTLSLDSPAGGPTVATVSLPLSA